jgi:hypothetical protein
MSPDKTCDPGTQKAFADLNGDGLPEVLVTKNDGFRNNYVFVLQHAAAPACFRQVFAGVNTGLSVQSARTNGWSDLRVGTTVVGGGPPHSEQSNWAYNGQKYVERH